MILSPTALTLFYLISAVLFILSLRGLSSPVGALSGNLSGMLGMSIAVIATTLGSPLGTDGWAMLIITFTAGASIGLWVSRRVKMTQMPELVALMHSFVGLAACLVAFASNMNSSVQSSAIAQTLHRSEIVVGMIIGAITFSGSLVAFGKLSGRLPGKSVLLPGRHQFNLAAILALVVASAMFATSDSPSASTTWLMPTIVLALLLGIHMVLAIGGADMPIVISMLNSYSGWAAAATGFMLSNDLLIITGALVGSSGAILSYIMCRAMNRSFFSVLAGGFGTRATQFSLTDQTGEIQSIPAAQAAELLKSAKTLIIVPGYGMAVAHAQHAVYEIARHLNDKGIQVRFAIHPVAGRMPGHMNVLLAEAKVPYTLVTEMEDINDDFATTDVVMVVGANDIVNPAAQENPTSPIAGMPVLQVWQAATVIIVKRSMAPGYAGIDNPLFYKQNSRMLFGDAQKILGEVLHALKLDNHGSIL